MSKRRKSETKSKRPRPKFSLVGGPFDGERLPSSVFIYSEDKGFAIYRYEPDMRYHFFNTVVETSNAASALKELQGISLGISRQMIPHRDPLIWYCYTQARNGEGLGNARRPWTPVRPL